MPLHLHRMPSRPGEPAIAAGEIRVEIDGLLEEFLGGEVVVRAEFAEMPQAALIGRPGVEAARRLAHRPLPLRVRNDRSNRYRHRLGDLVLQREYVGEITVVAFGPNVVAG